MDVYHHHLSGIQAYFYFTELGWEGGQSHPLWQCSHPWDDLRYSCLDCIRCHSSRFNSLAYCICFNTEWVMQVRFSLSSSPVFSRTDTATDSERFYTSILELFDDVDENAEVEDLLTWWNRSVSTPTTRSSPSLNCHFHSKSQIFPNYSSARCSTCNSALARIKEKRAELKAIALNVTHWITNSVYAICI